MANELDFRLLFEESPEVLLVLLPDAPRYTMVAATHSGWRATHTTPETLGRGLFEVFPRVGFDMRHADRLFRIFQRLQGAEQFEGKGVGLSIVLDIVERHGGHISAKAAPGAGAEFTFTLPAPHAS
jgi:hypothetical protein